MIFSSFVFLFFFITVVTLCVVVPQRYRKLVLLVASYYFYAYWDVRFTLLILASTLVDFVVGPLIHHARTRVLRRMFLFASLASNLGILFFFKYYNFFVDSAAQILSTWGLNVTNLNIILPVGISFFTFQTMSYSIDIYRGKIKPVRNIVDFALFVSFFPQLVAGPIVRASEFLPQLKNPVKITRENLWAGFQIFLMGLFKKLMIADAVAPLVDQVYANPAYFSSVTVWLAIIGYGIQIYCDFSGYSDMAIGCARMLGFRFNQNFNMPYLSRNIAEFWRRWHISLSSWLRDYLYISLGGSKKGNFRTYVNLLVTMLLGGLWHGASWNFVIWGGVHGIALGIHRAWNSRVTNRSSKTKTDSNDANLTIVQVGRVGATLLFVLLTWVFFRAQDLETTLAIFRKLLFIDAGGTTWIYTYVIIAILFCVIGHIVGARRNADEHVYFRSPRSLSAAFAVVITCLTIFVFAPNNVSPFIYFQF